MMARRAILKLIGVAPLAGPSAAAELAGAMASPTTAAALAFAASAAPQAGAAPISALESKIGRTLFRQLTDLRNKAEIETNVRRDARNGIFDPDIAALKSCSFAYKAAKQREREMDASWFLSQVQQKLWG